MLRIILLQIIGLQTTYGQSLTGQVFYIAERYLQDKCTVISQGDCDTSDLFFLTDNKFCLVIRCIYNDTYYSGTYLIKDGKLILTFKQALVNEIVDDQTYKVDNKIMKTKIEPSEYKISSCGQKMRLVHSIGENGFRRPQIEEKEMIKKLKEKSAWKLLQD
ncbi:MAG: hypothetical protein HYR67_10875 [Bacteroidetes bacterium]|nr:hypothetical protein [Bacteroidota bacterium]